MKIEDVQRKKKNIVMAIRLTQEDSLFMKEHKISPTLVFENAIEELKKKVQEER